MPQLEIESTEQATESIANWFFKNEEFEKEKKDSLLDLQKSKKINGFRPGKAPLSVIESKFLPQVQEKIIINLANSNMQRVEAESKNGLYQVLHISSFRFEKDGVHFSIIFEVQPIIKFEKTKIQLLEYIPKITESDIKVELDLIQNRYSEFIDFSQDEEKIVNKDTFVVIDLEVLKNKIPDGKPIKGLHAIIGSKTLFPKDPKSSEDVETLLLTKKSKVGDEIRYKPQSLQEKSDENNSSNTIELIITLVDVKKIQLPDLTDAFVLQHAGDQKIPNLAELKKRLESNLKANFVFHNIRNEIGTYIKNILESKLVQIEIPKGYYKKELGVELEELEKLDEKDSSNMYLYLHQQVLQKHMIEQSLKKMRKLYNQVFEEYMTTHFAAEDVKHYVQELSELRNGKITEQDPRYQHVQDKMQSVYDFLVWSFIKEKSGVKKSSNFSYHELMEHYQVNTYKK